MNTDATLTCVPDRGSCDHGSKPARLAAAALSACWCCWRWMAAICASLRRTSASESAPRAGRKAAGTGWAGATGRCGCGCLGAAVLEGSVCTGGLVAVEGLSLAVAELVDGLAEATLWSWTRRPPEPRSPQPAVDMAARSSATAVTPAAQYGRRDPDTGHYGPGGSRGAPVGVGVEPAWPLSVEPGRSTHQASASAGRRCRSSRARARSESRRGSPASHRR